MNKQYAYRTSGFAAIASIVILSFFAFKRQQQTIGTFERIDPAINALISEKATIEEIASGYAWTEGPLWIESKKMLLFSDVPNNKIMKWTKEKGAELYLTPSGYTGSIPRGGETGSNGLLLNSDANLVMCQHGDRRLAFMNAPLDNPKADFITLADNYQGKKFDSPNDAVFHSNGDLYFTDPPYGLERNVGDPLKQAPYQGVYRLSKEGKVTLLVDSVTRPNGIAFLPGEKSLIIACSDAQNAFWYIYDVRTDGTLANGRLFADAREAAKISRGAPDGFKIDSKGNVFASGPGGIWIFNKTGKLLGKIKLNRLASNCSFGDNEKTLYVTADKTVLKIALR